MKLSVLSLVLLGVTVLYASCATSYIKRSARTFINAPSLAHAHVGIAVYDAGANKYLYNHQADKYFVPASNAKIFTLYAALTSLKDSLAGVRYRESADSFYILPTGDPTFLHPDFSNQPVVDLLQKTKKPIVVINTGWEEQPLGEGWAWDDYNDSYSAERSLLPVYGNVIRWTQSIQTGSGDELVGGQQTYLFSEPEVTWKVRFIEDRKNTVFSVRRKRDENVYEIKEGKEPKKSIDVPFLTHGISSALELLKDTIGQQITSVSELPATSGNAFRTVFSQPSDSVYKLMMNRSDNFFAEQLLLMASAERSGVMNDRKIIDSMLKRELKLIPQRPNWVDGSGLSRYNLFTPMDFVWILEKMKTEFGIDRLKAIFPSGNKGTLDSYYMEDSLFIFAKTGTLSSHVALSGFLISRNNKLLIFSIMVNNHQSGATAIRRSIETFLTSLRKKM